MSKSRPKEPLADAEVQTSNTEDGLNYVISNKVIEPFNLLRCTNYYSKQSIFNHLQTCLEGIFRDGRSNTVIYTSMEKCIKSAVQSPPRPCASTLKNPEQTDEKLQAY